MRVQPLAKKTCSHLNMRVTSSVLEFLKPLAIYSKLLIDILLNPAIDSHTIQVPKL